jgi:hypothetical protein
MAGLRVLQATRTPQPDTEPHRTSARIGPIYRVMVACARCGIPQTFQGTVAEIGYEAEIWSRGHQCADQVMTCPPASGPQSRNYTLAYPDQPWAN